MPSDSAHFATLRRPPRPALLAARRGALLALLALALAAPLQAAPKADLWPLWEKHNAANRLHIDHGAWSEFLQRNVITKHPSGINRLPYGRVTDLDKRILDAYIAQQQALPISNYNRKEQKAYWINLYNALTVQVVLEHYPVKSIRDIDLSSGLFSRGPWDAKLVKVEGTELSLNDIEHRILRPIWHDPRVHYALNCASLGCPNLQPVAFTVFNMDGLLDDAARAYVNSPRGAHFEGDRLIVSSIYAWYQEDFGGPQGVLKHLRHYAKGPLALRLANWHKGFDDAYDWRLNAP